MSTFTWTITQMDCYPQVGDKTNVVLTVHWNCFGTDGTYASSIFSTCSMPSPIDSFIPYDDLTQSQVLGWIWANGIDQSAIELAVEKQIQSQLPPTVITPILPWKN